MNLRPELGNGEEPQAHPFRMGYAPSSIHKRDPVSWPGGKPLALAFMVCGETYELCPPEGAQQPPNLPGGFGRGPYPDLRAWSTREYGNRVGFFRVADELARHNLRATLAVDALTARHKAEVLHRARFLNWDVAAHGQAVTQMLSSTMSEDDERCHIGRALKAVGDVTGEQASAWHGAEYGQSARTPALLAMQGVRCLLDFTNDEQPYAVETSSGRLIAVPIAVDLDDVFAHWHRKISMPRWVGMVLDAVEQLAKDGSRAEKGGGRCLVVNLHPWLIGQPWRATYLRELLDALMRRDDIWHATPIELADHWARNAIGS